VLKLGEKTGRGLALAGAFVAAAVFCTAPQTAQAERGNRGDHGWQRGGGGHGGGWHRGHHRHHHRGGGGGAAIGLGLLGGALAGAAIANSYSYPYYGYSYSYPYYGGGYSYYPYGYGY
jgi:hypothetical protein